MRCYASENWKNYDICCNKRRVYNHGHDNFCIKNKQSQGSGYKTANLQNSKKQNGEQQNSDHNKTVKITNSEHNKTAIITK